jgi:hypothetical protein
MTVSWPIATLRPRQLTSHIAARTTAGTTSASGFTQRVASPAQGWIIKYEGIVLSTAAQHRAWRALAGALDGGANPLLVYIVEQDRLLLASPFDDDTMFGDGTGWDEVVASTGTTVGSASAGDTTVTIHLDQIDPPILPGHYFSIIGPARLYLITAVIDDTGGDFEVTIRPPLRDDLPGGTTVDFRNLVCKCRLASDNEMMLSLDPAGIGTGNVSFIEDPSG